MPPQEYLSLLLSEISSRAPFVSHRNVSSIYFGGGTPSLVPADHIVSIIEHIANSGFKILETAEVTIEINPATVDPKKLDLYLKAGVNRFSVGAQSFNDDLLSVCGRKHSAEDTRSTLRLLNERGVNYSFDLLFALPGQNISDLSRDLDEVKMFNPNHLSAYCLTVPEGHPMDLGRPLEDVQISMFDLIQKELLEIGIHQYEISNFSKPQFESRHNLAYWTDQPYWGVGLSAHSYFPLGDWGTRFWNPKSWPEYIKQTTQIKLGQNQITDFLSSDQFEALKGHESLTDFFHMFLRMNSGFTRLGLKNKFGKWADKFEPRLRLLKDRQFLEEVDGSLRLTAKGRLLSNQVFADLLVTSEDWTNAINEKTF